MSFVMIYFTVQIVLGVILFCITAPTGMRGPPTQLPLWGHPPVNHSRLHGDSRAARSCHTQDVHLASACRCASLLCLCATKMFFCIATRHMKTITPGKTFIYWPFLLFRLFTPLFFRCIVHICFKSDSLQLNISWGLKHIYWPFWSYLPETWKKKRTFLRSLLSNQFSLFICPFQPVFISHIFRSKYRQCWYKVSPISILTKISGIVEGWLDRCKF